MGRMQRGPGLRHGIRAEVLGRSGVGRRRSQEPDESAQQQGRQEGIYINEFRPRERRAKEIAGKLARGTVLGRFGDFTLFVQ